MGVGEGKGLERDQGEGRDRKGIEEREGKWRMEGKGGGKVALKGPLVVAQVRRSVKFRREILQPI